MQLEQPRIATPPGEERTPARYRAYGMVIQSDLALPELEGDAGSGAPDLVIRLRAIDRAAPAEFGAMITRFDPGEAFLAWGGIAKFLILDGSEVIVEPAAGQDESFINYPLLGAVLAIVLDMRGFLVLHGSAVTIGGRAALFLGDKGAGKSTTASALVAAGYGLLTDDVLAVDMSDPARPMAMPGYPQIKLSDAAAAAFTPPGTRLIPTPSAAIDKNRLRLTGRFDAVAVPVGAAYVLERSDNAGLAPLAATAGMQALMRFSYMVRFGRSALGAGALTRHMAQCAALADAAGVGRLQVPRGLERMDELIAFLRRDLAGR